MKYISTKLYQKMIDHALTEGISKDKLEALPIPPNALKNLQAVPAHNFFSLHEFLDQQLGPGFAVRIGQQMKMDDYGVLGLSWKTCSKVGDIFLLSERYFKMLSNTYVFKVEQEEENTHTYLMREAHRRGVALSNEATFSATVVVLQAMAESPISPVHVSFQHAPPSDLRHHEAVFNCPILFNQASNCISYRTVDFESRTAKADTSIHRFLMERVEEETKGIEFSAIKVAADTEQLIRDALPGGIPSITQIGAHMGMSSRTLTRRLATNGITFR
ncbi:MAG: AraC family transcriptional regulator ligand-binding domain-containing protein [Bacteroidota bacterium]